MGFVNAAERFLAASRARDVDAAAAELAKDVVMLNPATDDRLVGQEAVVAALRAVEEACDEFRHTHLLAEISAAPRLFGLVSGPRPVKRHCAAVDLVELDENERIRTLTVMARPMSALMALGARMSSPQRP
jgi:hypothetical protein